MNSTLFSLGIYKTSIAHFVMNFFSLMQIFIFIQKVPSIRYNESEFSVLPERALYKVQWVKTACTL